MKLTIFQFKKSQDKYISVLEEKDLVLRYKEAQELKKVQELIEDLKF